MKLQLAVNLKVEESAKEKIQKAFQDHPQVHLDLARCIVQNAMLAFRLMAEDKVEVEGFYITNPETKQEKPHE